MKNDLSFKESKPEMTLFTDYDIAIIISYYRMKLIDITHNLSI